VLVVCPGCGARNPSTARTCDWCGRPFFDERRSLPFRWMAPAIVGLVGILLSGVVLVSLLGARQSPTRTAEQAIAPPIAESLPISPAPVEQVETTAPEVAAVPTPVVEPTLSAPVAVVPVPTSLPSVAPTPDASTSTAAVFLKIANTDRQGAFIRREPRSGAPGIVALRDGVVVRVVGPDVTVDGRIWRNVSDGKGSVGWTPGEFLVPSDTGF